MKILSIMTLKMKISITTLRIMTTKNIPSTQHNDPRFNHRKCVTQLNDMLSVVKLSVFMPCTVKLSVFMPCTVKLSVFTLSTIKLSVFMLSTVKMSVFMQSTVKLSVKCHQCVMLSIIYAEYT
jgi:hypothetical protein